MMNFTSKSGFTPLLQNGSNRIWNQDIEEEIMLSERIEEQDLKDYKIIMNNRLREFRDEWNELKHISIQPEAE